jgi:UDP-3-O-[3-hydroxymyristoyl] glucosamine N-acyltransferase
VALTLGDLAVRTGARLRGDPGREVCHVGTLAGADGGAVSFLANPRYARQLSQTRAGAVILRAEHLDDCPVDALVADDPYATYARVAAWLHPPGRPAPGVHPTAVIGRAVVLGEGVSVGPRVVLEDGVDLADHVVIGAGSVIGRGCRIGPHSTLHANVTLYHDVTLGARVIVHSGAVLGADGFGMAPTAEGWLKVPQVGGVRVGSDVEIGASTTIDRGAIEDTVIGDGARLDNLIQVAHNVEIGAHSVVAGCVGISGSTRIGQRCMIGGAVCLAGHLEIGDDVVITGMSMVTKSLPGPGVYSSGIPAEDNKRWARGVARYRQLDTMMRRLKTLEEQFTHNAQERGD